jgi:hypothetical protein
LPQRTGQGVGHGGELGSLPFLQLGAGLDDRAPLRSVSDPAGQQVAALSPEPWSLSMEASS